MHIIDSDDYKASGIETMFFSGGEPHVKVPELPEELLLFLKLRTWNDVGIAKCVLDVLDRRAMTTKAVAFVPYFPGARQDKPSDRNSPLTASIVGELLYHFHIPVVTFDIHSEAAYDLALAVQNLMPADLKIPIKNDVAGIIAPDAGAAARAAMFLNQFYPDASLIQCSKKRNQETGKLSDYLMPPLNIKGRYIIVDDICDGGRTFNMLADEFKKDPVGQVSNLELFVSHGIFSRGIGNLHPAIEHITTTDSFCWHIHGGSISDSRLTVLPLAPLFPLLMTPTKPRASCLSHV